MDGLVHPRGDEPPLTPTEVLIHVVQLVAAGTDTIRGAISNLVYELLRDPDRWQRLRNDRTLLGPAIEESLRLDAPIQYVLRTVEKDTDVDGHTPPAGARALLSLQSANRDRAAWGDDADTFSLDRERSTAHLAFGYGIHSCLGAPLARIEVRAMLEALLDRYPNMRLAPDYQWRKVPGDMLRRPAGLEVDLDGGRAL
jgi:cytochrome P450